MEAALVAPAAAVLSAQAAIIEDTPHLAACSATSSRSPRAARVEEGTRAASSIEAAARTNIPPQTAITVRRGFISDVSLRTFSICIDRYVCLPVVNCQTFVSGDVRICTSLPWRVNGRVVSMFPPSTKILGLGESPPCPQPRNRAPCGEEVLALEHRGR